jgi:hypothetical protein
MQAPRDIFHLASITIEQVHRVATCVYIAQTNHSHIRKITLIFSKSFRTIKVESNELFQFQLFLKENKFSQLPNRKDKNCYECILTGKNAERLCNILYNSILIEEKAPIISEY